MARTVRIEGTVTIKVEIDSGDFCEAVAPVFAKSNKHDVTVHFVGQGTIFTLTSDRGTDEK